ncbi:MAG TPA: TfoX/Sxy family protein [Woeseiaceae bacterium]|nr:TfoX/Sxy family protein [Woeseiaceae bacterium]
MNEFVEHVLEMLEHCGTIRARRMFGGYGLYCDDLIFGLISGDVLYLKTDAESVGLFEERGLAAFVYVKKGEPTKTSYYSAPEEFFEDPEAAAEWLRIACDASRRRIRKPL